MASEHPHHEASETRPPELQRMLANHTDLPGGHVCHAELEVFCGSEGQEEKDGSQIEKGLCGIGRCTPRWAQKLANLPLFVAAYGMAGIWMSAMGPMLSSQITSIERHLGLSTSSTGLIMSANDIGYLMAVMIGSHLGKHLHIPRTLCLSAIIFGMTAAVMALGKLTDVRAGTVIGQNASSTGSDDNSGHLCGISSIEMPSINMSHQDGSSLNSTILQDDRVSRNAPGKFSVGLPWAFWLMIIAEIVGGMVKSYRLPLFTFYVEGNVKDSSRSALLLGTSFATMVFGPPIALLIGAYISQLHVDLKETSMSQLDQRWVGAWWIGFLVVSAGCIATALPIMCFPRYLTRQVVRNEDHDGIKSITAKEKPATVLKQIMADLPRSLKQILKRPVFVLTLCTCIIESFIVSGSFAFSQKYMEVQFNKTPQQVSMWTGILIIFALASGTFLGGVITTRLKMGLRGCVITALLRSSVLLVLQFLFFVYSCDNTQFAEPVLRESCMCDADSILVVCGDNQVNYLSPCVAGCTERAVNIFTNCSGIDAGLQQAKPGFCDDGCPYFIYFIATYCFLAFLSCMGIIPGYIQIIRTVELTDQALAMGTVAFCQTLLGTLPSPVLFGKLIDSTCQIWSPVGGYCLVYKKDAFRLWFHGVGQIIRACHVVLVAVILWLVLKKKIGSPSSEKQNNVQELQR